MSLFIRKAKGLVDKRPEFVKHAKECLANQTKHSHLNAFISRADSASVISQAERCQTLSQKVAPDGKSDSGRRDFPYGHLIGVKDNICTTDLPTTAASNTLKNFTSPYDATVVQQLRDMGAIIAGKTNMDEFGMGSHSTHSLFGPVKQAGHGEGELSAGGSSGGSAVAVATGQCAACVYKLSYCI